MLPELGQIGPFVIRTYTFLLDVGILLGLGILTWHGWQIEDKPVEWADAGLAALVGGFIVGRLTHVFIHWTYFSEHAREILQVWRGGIDWHGALIGGLIGLLLASIVRGLIIRQVTDALAIILPIEALLIFAGCLSTSCGHGLEVTSLADYPPLIAMELPDLFGVTLPRLASQLYGMALSLLLLIVVWFLTRLIKRRGIRFWIIVTLLGLGTFAIAFTRGDAVPQVGIFRLDQVFDLAIAGLGLIGAIVAISRTSAPPLNEMGTR